MKEQKSKEGALLEGVSMVRDELVRLQTVKARSAIVESLASLSEASMAKARTVNKTHLIHYPDLQGARQILVSVSRSIRGLSDGVGAKRVSMPEYKEHLSGFLASMSSAEELISRHTSYSASSGVEALDDIDVPGSKVASRERRERAASQRSRAALERYRAVYGPKIPSNLKGKILQVATVPLLARFNSAAITPKALGRLGFDVDNISVESASGSDLGIVFNNQHLCLFSYANAIAEQEGVVQEEQAQNGSLIRRKNLQKQRNALRKEVAKLTEDGSNGQRLAEAEEELDDVNARLASIEDEASAAKKTLKTRAKRKLTPEQALSDYAYGIVDVINDTKRSGIEWALVSPLMLRGFKSPDMCGAWLMPKSELQTLLRFTGGELKLRQWGLPWGA